MKKLLALITVTALVFCLSACGSDKKDESSSSEASSVNTTSTVSKTDDNSSVSDTTTSSKDESSTESTTSSEASKPAASSNPTSSSKPATSKPAATAKNNLDKYLESQKDEIKAMEDAMSAQGMNMKIYGENGNTLVYKYTFAQQLDAATIKPILDQTMDESASSFKESLKDVKAECSAVTAIKVIYANADGKTITSRTFK